MQQISTVAGLKNAIQLLEVEQDIKGQQLKEQLVLTYESLRPVNIVRNTLKEIFSSSSLVDNLSGNAVGMTSGFLIRKLFIGKSGNIFKKLLGSVLQFGISRVIAENTELIKSVGHKLLQYFFGEKSESL
jgi:hypothetical protein